MSIDILGPGLPGQTAALADMLAATALSELTPDQTESLSRRYDEALAAEPSEENEVVLLLTRPFSQRLAIPEYYRYTGLHVVDWFLTRQDDVYGGCLLAVHAVLADLARVETAEAARHAVVPEHTAERLRRLHLLIEQVGEMAAGPGSTLRAKDLRELAGADPRLARQLFVLTRCSGFRRSDKHDEHIFLRAVHACELYFYMIRLVAHEAMSVLEIDRGEFLFRMNQLAACVDLLNATFHVLHTLSAERFLSFRDATGDASAVQSLNFHLMELVLYGHDRRKAETYAGIPHLDQVNDLRLRQLRSLYDLVGRSDDPEVAATFAVVERNMLGWRGRHYGLGRTYLSGMKGSGGTEGAAYLKRFVHKTGLPSGRLVADPDQLVTRFAFC